jgi:hypothetical protein
VIGEKVDNDLHKCFEKHSASMFRVKMLIFYINLVIELPHYLPLQLTRE